MPGPVRAAGQLAVNAQLTGEDHGEVHGERLLDPGIGGPVPSARAPAGDDGRARQLRCSVMADAPDGGGERAEQLGDPRDGGDVDRDAGEVIEQEQDQAVIGAPSEGPCIAGCADDPDGAGPSLTDAHRPGRGVLSASFQAAVMALPAAACAGLACWDGRAHVDQAGLRREHIRVAEVPVVLL